MFIEFVNNDSNGKIVLNTDHIASIEPSWGGASPTILQVTTRGKVEVTLPYKGVLEVLAKTLNSQRLHGGAKSVDLHLDLEAELAQDNQGRGENLA